MKTRSHLRGSRGQPAAQIKKGSFGVKTRSSGGFGRSSGCVKFTKPRVERSSGHLGARAGALSVEDQCSQEEDPLEREKPPLERLRRKSKDRDFTARAAASPLERPVSGLPLFLSPRWAFFDGLIFYPNFPFIFIAFICFILRILKIGRAHV